MRLFHYLFPITTHRTQARLAALRRSTDKRLLKFRLDTIPYYKHRAQRRIYDFILQRQRKAGQRSEGRVAGTGILALLRRRGLELFPRSKTAGRVVTRAAGRHGTLHTSTTSDDHVSLARLNKMTSHASLPGSGHGGNEVAYAEAGGGREKGTRRKKLAGYLKAAKEMGQSYQAAYASSWGSKNAEDYDDEGGIPGAFPDVAIAAHGDEELVLFPSYAKHHERKPPKGFSGDSAPSSPSSSRRGSRSYGESGLDQFDEAEYWRREWEKYEADKALVDVDVRGWIYSPHRGPMTRKNRLLIGLARQLSGIPAPKSNVGSRDSSPTKGQEHSLKARHEAREAKKDQKQIAKEAEEILRKGQGEEDVANRGGYLEQPNRDSDKDSLVSRGRSSEISTRHDYPQDRRDNNLSRTSVSSFGDEAPGPGRMTKTNSWSTPAEMSQAELLVANANLMARLRPFLTNPLVLTGITVFFYNEKSSTSRNIRTDDAGHFNLRAAIDFVPTHVKVMASEHLSVIEEVKIMEPKGVSVISDVDDTVKHSSIGSGSREIFRNVFIRDLGDLTIQGVKEWYGALYEKGVGFHYVSNSPWQLFPLLVSYFRTAGLPHGSYHLKKYSGMLQGIFEPVAERKKGTLERIMRDFPERRFLLVGDSGEADLEVYTDVVLANPGRIIGVFIRDVTTPRELDQDRLFFDSRMAAGDRSKRKIAPPPDLSSEASSRYASANGSPNPGVSHATTPSNKMRPPLPPRASSSDPSASRPQLPIRQVEKTDLGPSVDDLIDLDSDPESIPPPPPIREPHGTAIPRSKSDIQLGVTAESQSPNSRARPSVKRKPLALRSTSQSERAELSKAPTIRLVESYIDLPSRDAGKPTSAPPLPPKPRQLSSSGNNNNNNSSSFEKEDQERRRLSSHPLAQTQNISELSSPQRQRNEPQTWGAFGEQKGSDAYNALPAARDYIPSIVKPGKEASPYDNLIYSTAAKSAAKSNTSFKPAPPPPPPRRSNKLQTPETSSEDSSEDGGADNPISRFSSYPSYYSSSAPKSQSQHPQYPFPQSSQASSYQNQNQPQQLSKKVLLWKQRLKRAEEIMREKGVVCMTWRTGEEAKDVALALVEREMKALAEEKKAGR